MDPAQEQAMRAAFTEVYRLDEEIAATDNDTEVRRLIDQGDEVAASWQNNPDTATAWQWLTQITEEWPSSAERMREITGNIRRDLRVGETPFTPLEYRSLDQAGTLVDPVYRDEKRWREEHLTLAAEQGRLDASLQNAWTTPDLAADLAAAKGAAWNAAWGDHTGQWPPERQEWETAYAMDGVNRDEEREVYRSAYATERHRLENPEMNEYAEAAADMTRHGARIGRLLATATPATDPATAPPIDPAPEASAATALGHHQQPDPGAGHELG